SENSDSESSPGEGDYEDMSGDAQEQEGQEESESNRRQREEGEEDNSERDGDRSQSEEESEGSERTGQGERSRSVDRSDQTQEDTDDPETEGSALSEEPGTGTGEANQDDFQSLDEEYEGSRLKSQNSNYYNNYIEEFMRPDVEGGETGLPSEEMTNYRDFIINSLEDERIPANYREMVREYFNNIIEE
ncbi:MAG: hypothetical protein ACLFUI_06990, partial [Halanaerobiales bacterium]